MSSSLKNKHDIFPLLSKVVNDLLTVQATNCSSEGVNSVGGWVIDNEHKSLSEGNAAQLIWAKSDKTNFFK